MRAARSGFLVATGSYLAVTALIIGLALRHTGGVLVYSLDDPYIHMAVARTLAFAGTYGIGPGAYESASSSPGWTVLLAALIRLTNGHGFMWMPLCLNLIAGVWLLWVFSGRDTALAGLPPVGRYAAAAILPLALYLPGLAATGMEHTLHAALTLMVLIELDRLATGSVSGRTAAGYCGLLAIGSVVRPEALFVGLGCAAALLLVGQVRAALCSVAAVATPIATLGVINHLHGQYVFSNSVVAKTLLEEGGANPWLPHFAQILEALRDDVMLAALLAVILTAVLVGGRRGRYAAPGVAILVGALLHLNYAATGWLDRYQAYLIVSGSFIMLQMLPPPRTVGTRLTVGAVLVVLLVLLPAGKFQLMRRAPVTIENIYRAQYQLARFLAEAYAQRPVAVNDLGLVALLHGPPMVDLYGLGSHEVLRTWKTGGFNTAYVRRLAAQRGLAVVVVYEEWFGDYIPPEWLRVAIWTLDEPDSLRPWRVVFYAPSVALADELDRHLRAFAPTLPGGVAVQPLAFR